MVKTDAAIDVGVTSTRPAASGPLDTTASLYRVALALNAVATPEEVAQLIVSEVHHALGAEASVVYLTQDRKILELVAYKGLAPNRVDSLRRLTTEDPFPLASVVKTGIAEYYETPEELYGRFPSIRGKNPQLQLGASLAVPLWFERTVIGALAFSFGQARRFDASHREFLGAVAGLCAQALERARLHSVEQSLHRDLQEKEEQFREVVENLPALAWSARADGLIDFYNRRWYEYTGTKNDDMKGSGWRSVHDPQMLPLVEQRWNQSLATGEPFEMEFPLKGSDGTFRWFLTRVNPLKDRDGKVTRWIGTNTNIDEQRKHATLLREAIEARDSFLLVAGHELKTPLTPLALRLQTLSRNAAAQPESKFVNEVKSGLETAQRQLKRLTFLVNDVLDVSRITSGRFRMELEETDVAGLVRDIAQRHEAHANQQHCALTVDAPAKLLLKTSANRLDQVVSNLLDNALKYGPGKPIRVTLAEVEKRVRLSVEDHGIGVAPEHSRRIFDRFERAVSEAHYGGLGLGLYIARNIVEMLGGTITVKSQPTLGATFTVDLPMHAAGPDLVLSSKQISHSVADFFQISHEEAVKLVDSALAGDQWEPGPAAGTYLMPLRVGPRDTAKAFLVKINKGTVYPVHEHAGEERLFIFKGGLVEPDGRQLWAGSYANNAQGTSHWSKAVGDEDCLLAALQMKPSLGPPEV
jgi:PAS domain S-box-containing protein